MEGRTGWHIKYQPCPLPGGDDVAQEALGQFVRSMTRRASAVIGKWRIFEADLWTAKDLDLVEPAYIRFDADGGGEFKFICVAGSMACSFNRSSAGFTWEGFDEMDETSGSGDADLGDDGSLLGPVRRRLGRCRR